MRATPTRSIAHQGVRVVDCSSARVLLPHKRGRNSEARVHLLRVPSDGMGLALYACMRVAFFRMFFGWCSRRDLAVPERADVIREAVGARERARLA